MLLKYVTSHTVIPASIGTSQTKYLYKLNICAHFNCYKINICTFRINLKLSNICKVGNINNVDKS